MKKEMIQFGLALNITSSAKRSDSDVIKEFYNLGDLAEALDFYSLFVFEHHFSDYILSPAPLQTLSYFAGRTQKIKLGTSVIVLPWSQPISVAEQISLLDILSGGRGIYCFGKGRSEMEYEGFGISITESKARFIEAVKVIKGLLSNESFSYKGEFYSTSSITIRPKAFSKPQDYFYGSASSIDSIKLLAELELGLLSACNKDWNKLKEDVELHKDSANSINKSVQQPILFVSVSIDEEREKAFERAYKYIGDDLKLMNKHYNIVFDKINLSENDIKQQIVGNPSDCIEQISTLSSLTGIKHIVLEFSYGGMPYAETVKSIKLFSSSVMKVFNEYQKC
jgi:alkanesulfonate monooxygenase SsuD/methylene tetrahydromethanopterin reductase-like flavin-dependent oxidoreductase (luciferase family)